MEDWVKSVHVFKALRACCCAFLQEASPPSLHALLPVCPSTSVLPAALALFWFFPNQVRETLPHCPAVYWWGLLGFFPAPSSVRALVITAPGAACPDRAGAAEVTVWQVLMSLSPTSVSG